MFNMESYVRLKSTTVLNVGHLERAERGQKIGEGRGSGEEVVVI